ncbi:hypothetical protein ABID58_006128 [Bradyrhizobium sp. S3.2.6]|uniref:Uncharacterized protein n=1 Tax=Bradyrhizobium cytisi TaxID=515489 RepID=A0A5S4WT34_9BRAD|nr:hypothetical protein [Bradyrhizobium cytisi]TYL83340.1 hypothetical protein FXB38_18975 [Bradyrhizobium cytisi]
MGKLFLAVMPVGLAILIGAAAYIITLQIVSAAPDRSRLPQKTDTLYGKLTLGTFAGGEMTLKPAPRCPRLLISQVGHHGEGPHDMIDNIHSRSPVFGKTQEQIGRS